MTAKLKLPPIFLAMTPPKAHCDWDGSIVSFSFNISIPLLHAFDLKGSFSFAASLWSTAPSSIYISCSTKLQQPVSALCFEKVSAFPKESSSLSNILPLRRSFPDKIGLFAVNCASDGYSFILFKKHSLLACNRDSVFLNSVFHTLIFWVQTQRILIATALQNWVQSNLKCLARLQKKHRGPLFPLT